MNGSCAQLTLTQIHPKKQVLLVAASHQRDENEREFRFHFDIMFFNDIFFMRELRGFNLLC